MNSFRRRTLIKRSIDKVKSAQWAVDVFQATTINELLDKAAINAVELFQSPICVLLLVKDDYLVAEAAQGLDLDKIETDKIPIGKSYSGRLVKRGEPRLFVDVTHYIKTIPDNLEPYYSNSMISTPLVYNKQIVGLINICRPAPLTPFSREDLNRLISYGSQTTFAITSQRLVDKRTSELNKAQSALLHANEQLKKDITGRKLAEDELKQKTDQIISSQKEIESLYAKSENARKALLSILQDVNEKGKALRESEGRFRDVVNNTGDWIWEVDKEGRYTYSSPVVKQVVGYEDKEVLGKHFYDFFHPDERDELKNAVFELFKQKKPLKDFINRNVHKDGHVVILEISGVPLLDDSGNLVGYRGIDRDITPRKEAEEKLKETLEMLRKSLAGTIQAMSLTVETRDPYTAGHQRRVADFARAIATEMGLTADQIEGIRTASAIHDIGKISVPAEILSKPTKLSELEFSLIKVHSQSGYDILIEIDFPWPVARMVLEHHERMNGSGYPQGLSGDKLLIESRIIAVADVVEAMASYRPYRPELGIDKALDEISKNKGILYDQEVADVCLRLFREKRFEFPGQIKR
ncbi:MAG: PAS domain S-box protein [Proteobacteria bacterium]|nr:PAS domain S-box protein [Pseudomonadota bacterium]